MQPYIIIIQSYQLPGKKIYGAFVPDIPGCTVTGKTLEQTITLIRASLSAALLDMVRAGKGIPEPTGFTEWEQDYRETVETLEPENLLVAFVKPDMAITSAPVTMNVVE